MIHVDSVRVTQQQGNMDWHTGAGTHTVGTTEKLRSLNLNRFLNSNIS